MPDIDTKELITAVREQLAFVLHSVQLADQALAEIATENEQLRERIARLEDTESRKFKASDN